MVVADHSELGVVALVKTAPPSEADVPVTDEGAGAEAFREIELARLPVVVAEVSGARSPSAGPAAAGRRGGGERRGSGPG